MTIEFLLKHKAGVEALGRATWGDGALALRVLKVLKAFNWAIQEFQALNESAVKEINETPKDGRADLVTYWNRRLSEAAQVEAEFSPGQKFNGEKLGEKLSALELLDLDELGLLE